MTTVAVQDLRREFVVRRSTGRLRRERTVVRAVDGVSFSIADGESVGYIGANGAGKSTTIKLLTGCASGAFITTRSAHPSAHPRLGHTSTDTSMAHLEGSPMVGPMAQG